MTNRNFKGVWVSKEIWLAKDLGWSEKLLLVEIDSLDGEQGCFASNDYLASFFNLSKGRVSKMISSLKDKGYITVEMQYKVGTKSIDKRIIRVNKMNVVKNDNTPSPKQLYPLVENDNTPMVENSQDNNTIIFNKTINNTTTAAAPLFTSILKRIDEQLLESVTMVQKQQLLTYINSIEDPAVIYECINIAEQETPDWPVQYLFKLLDKAVANKFTLDDVIRDHQQFKQQNRLQFENSK